MAALFVWLFISLDKRYILRAIDSLLVVLALILIINGAHWFSVFQMYHSPMSINATYADASTTAFCDMRAITPGNIFANVLRFLTDDMHFPFLAINKIMWFVVLLIFAILRIDPGAPGYLVPVFHFPAYLASRFHEVYAGCPLQTILSWLAIIYALRNLNKDRLQPMLAWCLIGIYFLMCFFLRWGPFSCRYHLAFFFMSIPLIICWLRNSKRINLGTLGTVLIITAIPYALLNDLRPLLGDNSVIKQPRIHQLFVDPLGGLRPPKGYSWTRTTIQASGQFFASRELQKHRINKFLGWS